MMSKLFMYIAIRNIFTHVYNLKFLTDISRVIHIYCDKYPRIIMVTKRKILMTVT